MTIRCGMTGRVLGGALAVMAGVASAQPAELRSGEHDGFSRLVLDIGAGRDWVLEGGEDRWTVVFDPALDGIDASGVFERISRDRIAEVGTDTGLSLGLSCACSVTAFRFDETLLVIDVADLPPAPDGPDLSRDAPVPSADQGAGAATALQALPDWRPPLPVVPPASARTPGDAAPAAPDISLDDAARIMGEQLARAAASGLLEAAGGRPLSDADPIRPDPPPDAARDPAGDMAAPAPPLRATTALEADARPPLRAALPGAAPDPFACGHSDDLRLGWSDAARIDDGLGALRAALFDDRDRPVPGAARALSRHYLQFGFADEAIHWLDTLPAPSPPLQALARVIAGEETGHFPPIDNLSGCHDGEIFWRYLDGAVSLADHPQAVEAIERATAALPPVLRAHIGPRLARRLAGDGAQAAAHTVRDLLDLSGVISSAALLHLDLDLGIQPPGDAARTRDRLAEAAASGGADPARAMAQLMRYDRLARRPPDPGRLTAAEALLRETGGAAAVGLWHEVVLARVADGAIDDALIHLSGSIDLPRSAPEWQATFTAIIADRADASDTLALLVLARLHGETWTQTGSAAGRARIAAMAHLRAAGLSPAADMLRGGQRQLILPARPAADPSPGDRLRQAWLASDWDSLADSASDPHQAVALRMQRPPPPPAAPIPALPEIAAAIADSRDLRATLDALLATPAPHREGAE